jgi:hypothetical protein
VKDNYSSAADKYYQLFMTTMTNNYLGGKLFTEFFKKSSNIIP